MLDVVVHSGGRQAENDKPGYGRKGTIHSRWLGWRKGAKPWRNRPVHILAPLLSSGSGNQNNLSLGLGSVGGSEQLA